MQDSLYLNTGIRLLHMLNLDTALTVAYLQDVILKFWKGQSFGYLAFRVILD